MGLVDDDRDELLAEEVRLHLAEQDAVRHELDPRVLGAVGLVVPDLVADDAGVVQLVADALADGDGSHAARLCHADHVLVAAAHARLVEELRHLRGLTTPGVTGDDQHVVGQRHLHALLLHHDRGKLRALLLDELRALDAHPHQRKAGHLGLGRRGGRRWLRLGRRLRGRLGRRLSRGRRRAYLHGLRRLGPRRAALHILRRQAGLLDRRGHRRLAIVALALVGLLLLTGLGLPLPQFLQLRRDRQARGKKPLRFRHLVAPAPVGALRGAQEVQLLRGEPRLPQLLQGGGP
mmetsp:Transcript_28150/g.62070  ORF Transcript_28150/g.62070 Transcript_28150/m.62070 type:complete len:291 (-) Transcript_28150:268-1140(-)